MSEADDAATLASQTSRALRPSPGRPRPTLDDDVIEVNDAEADAATASTVTAPELDDVDTDDVETGDVGTGDVETDAVEAGPRKEVDRKPARVKHQRVPARRRGSRLLTAAISIFALATVALGATDLALSLAKPGGDGLDAARAAAIANAKSRVPKTLTYSYKTIDTDIVTAAAQLTGEFKSQYTTLLTSQVKPGAISGQVSTTAAAVSVGVVSAQKHSVLVLVFLDLSTTSGKSATPQVNGSRVEVTMTEVGTSWLISALTPV